MHFRAMCLMELKFGKVLRFLGNKETSIFLRHFNTLNYHAICNVPAKLLSSAIFFRKLPLFANSGSLRQLITKDTSLWVNYKEGAV